MSKREFDFTETQKAEIRAAYGFICAACGADDEDNLEADHWIPGVKDSAGVCLCGRCNKAKGKFHIPEKYRLAPRESLDVVTHAEYRAQVKANRVAWQMWVAKYRGAKAGKKFKDGEFQAPH